MHELGVVFYIIDQVEEVARENQAASISKITVQIGEVSTVIPSYLEDCFQWARSRHPLVENAELVVEPIEAVTFCDDCGKNYATIQHGRICPYCGSGRTWLMQGNECLIKEIEVTSD